MRSLLKFLPLLRRLNPGVPVVLVGCQGDNKVHKANTMLDQDTVLDTDNVVMHVETAASTSFKSVMVAFQVAALACFNHRSETEENALCKLERDMYAIPNVVKVKLKNQDMMDRSLEDIYVNLPVNSRSTEAEQETIERKVSPQPKIRTAKGEESEKPKETPTKLVAIECHRLNKHKVLEKIVVEVSQDVFEALRDMNPELTIQNNVSRNRNILHLDSANFYLEKSLHEAKSVFRWFKSCRSNFHCSTYRMTNKTKVTSL